MNCDRAQAALSERMDGEHLDPRLGAVVDAHVDGCARCRAFASGAARVRTAVRIRPAEDVPDLTESIMSSVRLEADTRVSRVRRVSPARLRAGRRSRLPRRPAPARPVRGLGSSRWAPVAAALVVGLVAGSLAVGGPWRGEGSRPVAVAMIAREARAAARTLDAYHATFAIAERGLPGAPERHLSMQVWFGAPERFRLDVVDLTEYPSAAWTPTDLRFVADGPALYRSGPTGCPSDLPSGTCPPTRVTVTERSAFSPRAPLPADLVLPLDVLASTRGITVLGDGTVLGRDAVRVELSFERAAPLFPFLRLGGTWRPFYPEDRVVLWLDARSWFPLRWTVVPSATGDRRAWELRFGLPAEPADRPILDVVVTAIDERPPAARTFRIPGVGDPTEIPLLDLAAAAGFASPPIAPTATADLRLTSALAPPPGDETAPQTLLTYTEGLSYLRVSERRDWAGPRLFGPLDAAAEQVVIPGGGVAYYEPASDDLGRRLAIHSVVTNLYLETNLPREDLLAVAASLPVRGERVPRSWRVDAAPGLEVERVSLSHARREAPFPLALPSELPEGYAFASAELERAGGSVGVTIHLRQRATDLAGGPIRIHLEPADRLPPASSASQDLIDVAGAGGRWIAAASRLEWVRDGVYASIEAPDLDLRQILAIAASMSTGAGGATGAS